MAHTGGAWLSSARVVRCWVKSRTSDNPRVQLPAEDGDSGQTAGDKPGKAGMTSNHHAPYGLGYTRTTMADTESSEPARGSEPQKVRLSSDRSLQPDSVKPESLVIADQHAAVNTFSGLVHTARQTMGVGNARSRWPNPQGREPSKAGLTTGVKS